MPRAHQAPDHVRAHPPEADHSKLHGSLSFRATGYGLQATGYGLASGARDDLVEPLEPRADVGAQMHAQRATAPIEEHLEVAPGLRRLDDAKGVARARHGEVADIVAGDLQEDAAVGAALVGLPGRVQKARTETQARGDLPMVAHAMAQT